MNRNTRPQSRTQRAATWLPSLRLREREGSLLLEAIIAIGIFSIFLAGIGFSLLAGEKSTVIGGDRTRAAFLAQQQLEAIRQMRTTSFASLTTGSKGLKLTSSGWAFSGSSVKTDGYTARVQISSVQSDWLKADAYVSWNFGKARSGSVMLTTYLTDWRAIATVGNWANMSRTGLLSQSGSPDFQKIAVQGQYAYVTSGTTRGLYIYNISNPSSPVRVASSFDLGAAAYGLVTTNNRLFVTTSNSASEVQVYDISSPTTLSTSNLVNSYDLPGSGRARSIAMYGDYVFIGSLDDPPNHQFTAIQMSETGDMTLLDSMSLSGSALSVVLQDGYAYIGNANNAAELQVVDIFDPENITFAPGTGIDMTNTQDAYAVALSGTAALIGRANGSSIDELTLYDTRGAPVPNPPPGPWTLEIGGDVNALAMIYGSKYAFVGGSASAAQVRVLDLVRFAQGSSPVVKTYDASSTIRGLHYDWLTDKLFGVSSSSLFVFSPG